MRIFIDVGAHYGETLTIVLNPKWGFDRIYSLEPSAFCLKVLRRFRDPRLIIEPFALSNRNGTATLYGAGLLGGSLYADKRQGAETGQETIALVKASEWFAKLPEGEIYLKLNCEGGEADILDDLLDSGQIKRVTRMFVDFDIRKVPSEAHRQQEIEERLKNAGVCYVTAEGFGFGPQHRVEAWLEWNCRMVRPSILEELSYTLRTPLYERAVRTLAAILPRKLFWSIGRRFGRVSRY